MTCVLSTKHKPHSKDVTNPAGNPWYLQKTWCRWPQHVSVCFFSMFITSVMITTSWPLLVGKLSYIKTLIFFSWWTETIFQAYQSHRPKSHFRSWEDPFYVPEQLKHRQQWETWVSRWRWNAMEFDITFSLASVGLCRLCVAVGSIHIQNEAHESIIAP